MRFIKSDLLTLLVSLFILGSCKNPTGVGLDVDPNIALETKIDSSFEVNTKLLKQDSIVTNYTERNTLGYFNDPVFGKTTANLALGLAMPTTSYSFGTNTVLDSAILVLPVSDFYGDSAGSSFVAEVRQLNEVLYNESGKSYYSSKKWLTNSTLLASKNFKANVVDSITITDIRTGLIDSVKRVSGQLRIKLDANFVLNNIINLDSANKVSTLAFNNYIKGLFVSINKTTTSGAGGLFSIDAYTSGGAKLDVFYKTTNTEGVIDTLTNTFSINGASGNAATEVTWDMTGTAVKTELESTSTNSNLLYLKGLGGTYVKVDFPELDKLKALGTNVSINRAELIFYNDISPANGSYDPISRLRTYRWDIANRPQLVPDESPSDFRYLGPGFVGGYSNNNSYVFNFTGYIQDLMNGKLKDFGTFITPSDFTTASGLNVLGRSIVGGGSNTTYKVKLRVFYTDQK